jgi:hypothetical protein
MLTIMALLAVLAALALLAYGARVVVRALLGDDRPGDW